MPTSRHPPTGPRPRRSAPPTDAPETVEGAPDWRGLLDLFDEGGAASYDDLWRTWVARDEDLALLDARTAARARYDAVVGGGR